MSITLKEVEGRHHIREIGRRETGLIFDLSRLEKNRNVNNLMKFDEEWKNGGAKKHHKRDPPFFLALENGKKCLSARLETEVIVCM
jgi:quinol monooxygenase YgiN